VASPTPEQLRAEAEARVRRALAHIQEAQNHLGHAQAELSGIERGVRAWRLVGRLYDRVHAAWYRVEAFRKAGRFTLDGISTDTFAGRLAKEARHA
jgi:hypothetical protein